jgi:putative endonuclease
MKNRRQTGAAYEELAADWLSEQGLEILERNYRCRRGEIDLIARDGRYLVFVEVKYRSAEKTGHPAEAVDWRKQHRISNVAAWYCYEHRLPEDQPCRFDVVSVLGERIEYIKDAFTYC